MKYYFKITLFIVVFSAISLGVKAQSESIWTPAHILSFNSLKTDSFVLLHKNFIKPEKQNAQHLTSSDFPSSLQLTTKKEKLVFKSYLAADNPMFWSFKIIDDTTAEWFDLSCECNVGLESAIFGNMPNPYKKKIGTLHLQKDGSIKVEYSVHFKKEILEKTSFSNEFFKEDYKVFKMRKL